MEFIEYLQCTHYLIQGNHWSNVNFVRQLQNSNFQTKYLEYSLHCVEELDRFVTDCYNSGVRKYFMEMIDMFFLKEKQQYDSKELFSPRSAFSWVGNSDRYTQ